MNVVKKERNLLKLAANNCELFEVHIEIAEKDFLRDIFVKDLPQDIAESFMQDSFLEGNFDRRSKQTDYQARIGVHKADRDKKSPEMHFQVALRPTSARKRAQEEPPFAEDVFLWLHQCITRDAKVSLWERADFSFSTTLYRSVFSLPTVLSGPLNPTENEVFEGAGVIGISLAPQNNKAGVRFVVQSIIEKSIMMTLDRAIGTSAQKLLSIEADLAVLRTVALSTVRPKRRTKK